MTAMRRQCSWSKTLNHKEVAPLANCIHGPLLLQGQLEGAEGQVGGSPCTQKGC